MFTPPRKTTSQGRIRDGRRSPTIKQTAKKAASALATGRVLPRDSEAGAARVLEAMIRGVEVAQREGTSMHVEIVISPAAKIMVGNLTRIVRPIKGRDPNNNAGITAAMRRGEKT